MVYVVRVARGPSIGTVWVQDNRGLTLCVVGCNILFFLINCIIYLNKAIRKSYVFTNVSYIIIM